MEDIKNCSQKQIQGLQLEAKQFLTETKLQLGALEILPKDIEVYYYQEGVFEDSSVHRNELQQNNKNHFYVHRWGTKQSDPYKGGNYPGIDFVVSNTQGVYFSYLIRSAVVGGNMAVGPHKVLEAIRAASGPQYEDIEKMTVKKVCNNIPCDVLFSCRINLGKTVEDEYREFKLRAVLCDEWFRESKYPYKESMIFDFLSERKRAHAMTSDEAKDYAKKYLGYIPSKLK